MPFAEHGTSRTHYEVAGNGPAIVLLHGVGASTEVWAASGYVAALAQRFTVISVDIRGYGKSSPPESVEDFSLDRRVEDLSAVLTDLGIDRLALFGFSMGGRLAMAFAAAHPEMVRALIVGSANPESPWTNFAIAEGRSVTNRLLRLTPRRAFDAARRRVDASLGRKPPTHMPWYTTEQHEMLAEAQRRGLFEMDVDHVAEQLTMPALFFQGDRDDLFAAQLTEAFVARLPQGEFKLFKRQPHAILERSKMILPVIAPFLSANARP